MTTSLPALVRQSCATMSQLSLQQKQTGVDTLHSLHCSPDMASAHRCAAVCAAKATENNPQFQWFLMLLRAALSRQQKHCLQQSGAVISQFKLNAWIGCSLKGAQAAALLRLYDA